MFGIEDPMIWLAYLLSIATVVFSAWYSVRNWNKKDKKKGRAGK
jgi:hypothetical protein